jgi:hypothetical protein
MQKMMHTPNNSDRPCPRVQATTLISKIRHPRYQFSDKEVHRTGPHSTRSGSVMLGVDSNGTLPLLLLGPVPPILGPYGHRFGPRPSRCWPTSHAAIGELHPPQLLLPPRPPLLPWASLATASHHAVAEATMLPRLYLYDTQRPCP